MLTKSEVRHAVDGNSDFAIKSLRKSSENLRYMKKYVGVSFQMIYYLDDIIMLKHKIVL